MDDPTVPARGVLTEDTAAPASAKTPPVSADCQVAVLLEEPAVHKRCRGNGAYRIPAARTPILPKIKCGCACHAPAAS